MQNAINLPVAVIFDMDGVLLDTESMCDQTWSVAASEYGLTANEAQRALSACRGRNKRGTIECLNIMFGSHFNAASYLERTIELFHIMEVQDGIPVMRGAHDALQYLRDKGYLLALASSTAGETVRRQLRTAGLLDYFKTLTTGDTVTHSKPDSEIYIKAAASLELTADKCAAIEDSPNGVRSATAAGMKCIMVPDRDPPTDELRSLAWQVLPSLEMINTVL